MNDRQRNLLWLGDAAEALSKWLPAEPHVDLCYVDPPFNVGGTFSARTQPGTMRGRTGKAGGALAYRDAWGGVDAFVAWLERTVRAVHGVLGPSGQFWLHLDHRAVHEAKLLCDQVFGREAFLGEIIWVPGNGARGKRGPSMTHQTLLVYLRDPSRRRDVVWNDDHPLLREPYAEGSLRTHFRHVDENGRRYRERKIGGKTYRYYADRGRRLGSVWTDIAAMNANTPLRTEGTGYPTQKPEKLLERIVRLTTRPGDLVLDPMCGSGTTLVVAGRLDRRFAGGDESELAFEITRRRLQQGGLKFACLPNPEAREPGAVKSAASSREAR